MDKFFEGNFNETWNTTLNQFDALVGNISLYISCFEFNKFMAMPNEYEMEKLGIQLVDRKQLWAGIGITKIIIMPQNYMTKFAINTSYVFWVTPTLCYFAKYAPQ